MAVAAPGAAVRERPRKGRSLRSFSWDRLTPFVMITPSIVLIAIFVYFFIGYTAFVSTTKWYGIVPDYRSDGLQQYVDLFGLPRFQADVTNTIQFTILFLGACILLGFGAAVLLDQHVRGTFLFQNVFLFPLAISFVVTGTVWRWMFNPNFGINLLLDDVHLGFLKSPWLADTHTALNGLVIAAAWQMSGFCMAMFLAGLRGIPDDLREAARVDGASEARIFWRIVLPLMRPITLSAVVILGHISLKIFDLVYVMTFGGPGYATDMPSLYMWVAVFRQNLYGRGAAIAMVLLFMVALLIVPYLIWSMRQEVER